MKKYHFHPDKYVYIYSDDKVYCENLKLAKFDVGSGLVIPVDGATELLYVAGYGIKTFVKGDMVSFSDVARPDIDSLIDNIDTFLQKQKIRGEENELLWQIPEDMKTYTPVKDGASSDTLNNSSSLSLEQDNVN